MATIAQLAALVAERCSRPKDVPVFIRRGREAGYLPHSGSGGVGSVHAPVATTQDAVVLLLAMMQNGREPKAAVHEVDAWARLECTQIDLFSFSSGDAPPWVHLRRGDEAMCAAVGDFATGLKEVIDCCRSSNLAASMVPLDILFGRHAGTDIASIALEWRPLGEAPIARNIIYQPPGWEMTRQSSNETLSSLHSIGGGVLRAIGDLLGPLRGSLGDDPRQYGDDGPHLPRCDLRVMP